MAEARGISCSGGSRELMARQRELRTCANLLLFMAVMLGCATHVVQAVGAEVSDRIQLRHFTDSRGRAEIYTVAVAHLEKLRTEQRSGSLPEDLSTACEKGLAWLEARGEQEANLRLIAASFRRVRDRRFQDSWFYVCDYEPASLPWPQPAKVWAAVVLPDGTVIEPEVSAEAP